MMTNRQNTVEVPAMRRVREYNKPESFASIYCFFLICLASLALGMEVLLTAAQGGPHG